jgi:bacterioferritin-associated ferredoxin
VSDREVNRAIEAGATTREQVTRACRAGGDCGACHQMIEDMIDHNRERLVACSALVRERAA